MKVKLIQILLGAIGSALTVIIGHFASAPTELVSGAALAAGPASTVVLGDVVSNLFS